MFELANVWRQRVICALIAAVGMAASSPTSAQLLLPEGFQYLKLPEVYDLPVGIKFADDGTMFVIEKGGKVLVHDGTAGQSTPFIDLTDEVNNDHDRGMLGIELSRDFVADGGPDSWVYLLYTVSPVFGQDTTYNQDDMYSFSRLTRYRAVTVDGEIVADPASRHILLGNQEPDGSVPDAIASLHASHSVGSMHMAGDGSLLLATGDGAHFETTDTSGLDAPGFDDFIHPATQLRGPTPVLQDSGAFRAQDLRSLSGKILRIDPNTANGFPDNPFFDGDLGSHASRVWALGLRNPYRTTLFPDAPTHDSDEGHVEALLIGDVGWGQWEELDVCHGGENFGWPCFEGFLPQPQYQAFAPPVSAFPTCHAPSVGIATPPALAMHHSKTESLSPAGLHVDGDGNPLGGFSCRCVVSGAFYTGGSYPEEYHGLLFFTDYVYDWVRTVRFDENYAPVEIRDFSPDMSSLVDIQRHPITGDLYAVQIFFGKIGTIQYVGNKHPIAAATAGPLTGPLPLDVSFDGGASTDPDGDPLTYVWDFGDGSPIATTAQARHTYTAPGVFQASLTVSDPAGLSATEQFTVFPGNSMPEATILAPRHGDLLDPPTSIELSGAGFDPDGDTLQFEWRIDLVHDTHVHPGTFFLDGPSASFPVEPHGNEDDVIYYLIELTVTDSAGAFDRAHVYVYEADSVRDVTGTSPILTRLSELTPPVAMGQGNLDPEVMRDAVAPAVGSSIDHTQFDTFHTGDKRDDDWIGCVLAAPPVEEFRFTRLLFQEGMHFADGGWFEDLWVEARVDGDWVEAENLVITPEYPFELAGDEFFDQQSFDTYQLDFDPVFGDAIRLRGNPGGSADFISCGELRAFGVAPADPPGSHVDITPEARVIAKLYDLEPPAPQGSGNPKAALLFNGTYPPVGSASSFAQFDTSHGGDQGDEDWIGYQFSQPRTLSRLEFQEGLHQPDGGWFETLQVEVLPQGKTEYEPVSGLVESPAYPRSPESTAGYETYTFDFEPVVAWSIRLRGDPGGSTGYISVAELRALEPATDGDCGWSIYGAELGGANTLEIDSVTPVALGLPLVVDARGAAPFAAGFFLINLGAVEVPILGGTLLVNPVEAFVAPVAFDANGTAALAFTLSSGPALEGQSLHFQAFAATGGPLPWQMSNGLRAVICGG